MRRSAAHRLHTAAQLRCGEPKMAAQRSAGVLVTEQPAALELGDDPIGEFGERAGRCDGEMTKPSHAPLVNRSLELVGNLARRPDELRHEHALGVALADVAQRQALGCAQADDGLEQALHALHAHVFDRLVQRVRARS